MVFGRSKARRRTPDDAYCRTDVLNDPIRSFGYSRYLEIGVRDPADNFEKIRANEKESVDPEPRATSRSGTIHRTISDEFFARLDRESPRKYDLVFIDALHLEHQALKDAGNALRYLSRNGTIVLHDCSPGTEFRQREVYEVEGKFPPWNGTVRKAFARLRCTRPDLLPFVIDCDEGCGVIRHGSQDVYGRAPLEDCLDYAYLEQNREVLLNLWTVEEFKDWLARQAGRS